QSFGRPVEEFGRTLMTFAETAIAEKVDAAVLAGDTWHTRAPSPGAILQVIRPVRAMAEAGIPVVIDLGNHEMASVAGGEGTTLAWLGELDLPNVYVATEGRCIHLDCGTFAVLPYVHKRSVEGGTLPERMAAASAELAFHIAAMADFRRPGLPLVFVGHLTVTGAMLGSEAAMQLGWDATVAPEAFAPYDLACLGHIHAKQVVSERAFYAGSPDVHGFDDDDASRKGFWLHDTDANTHRFIPSHPRAFVTVPEADLVSMAESMPQGAVALLVLADERTPAGIRDAVRLLKDAGAFYVRITTPEKHTVSRTQQAVDVTPRAQMEAWLAANKYPIEPALAIAEEVMAS